MTARTPIASTSDPAGTPVASAKVKARATADPVPDRQFLRMARPDALDYRDRAYRPNVGRAPAETLFPEFPLTVRHQGNTNACTGFALAVVVEHLLRVSKRDPAPCISPFMLYSMARRYDEFPGSSEDAGSSSRGALKGWFKHGVCREALFPDLNMPAASATPETDWWADAVNRPLGSYYRIDPQAITDMHAALNEVGALLVSAGCHKGWDEGIDVPTLAERPTSFDGIWEIPVRGGHAAHEGHAFAIVGYNHRGFLIQNSWGPEWGSHGLAILSYDDWLRNAMDCWVAQLGVVTQEHRAIARSVTLRADRKGKVALSANRVLRDRELSPFIVNMGSNGRLSNSGVFRTTPDDVRALVDVHMLEARSRWAPDDGVIDVCIFAHGGLVGESQAAAIAAQWIPLLYEHRIFPVFLMWETDFFGTALRRIEEAVKSLPGGGACGAANEAWWNERLERLLARPGTLLWRELKQNADAMSRELPGAPEEEQSGGVLLFRHFQRSVMDGGVRLHVVAHSAGSLVASHMIDRLAGEGLAVESVSFLAPAVTVQAFDQLVRPHLDAGTVRRYQQFHLTDAAEEEDGSCGAYRRSLLYLVSQSFEGGTPTPVLGMEKHFEGYGPTFPNATAWVAPGPVSGSTTHGRFDNDPATRAQVLRFMAGARGAGEPLRP